MRPCGSNQQNGGRRSVNQRNLLPRPQSNAFETGGKLIIKTSGGAGKYGKRRKVPINSRSCFALVSKLSMIAFILPNPLVSFFSHKMNRACGGRSENVSLHWALGCMNSFHFSARVGYPRYSCKRDIVCLLLLLDVSRTKSLTFASHLRISLLSAFNLSPSHLPFCLHNPRWWFKHTRGYSALICLKYAFTAGHFADGRPTKVHERECVIGN